MNEFIGTFEMQRKSLKQFSDMSSLGNNNNNTAVKLKISLRAKIFLLRSIITSIGSVVNTMSSFAHSYLARILEIVLPTHQFAALPGVGTLLVGVDNAIEEIIASIKPRLSVPVIVSVTVTLTDCGHSTALAFVRQLSTVFRRLDRTEVVTHLGDLCAICVLYLDYRRVYGDESDDAQLVETAAVEAAVELSIKLTESELKSFLVHLEEWRDIKQNDDDDDDEEEEAKESNEDGSVKSQSRGVCFYHFMSALGNKLKSIFTPLMAPFWDHSAEELFSFASTVSSVYESILAAQPATKRTKKSKSTEGHRNETAVYAEVAANSRVKEFKMEIKYLLESVSLTCLHDSDGFIDDVSSIVIDSFNEAIIYLFIH